MKHPLTVLGILLAASLYLATVCEAMIPVEPYSSRPTDDEMAFVTRWRQFLLRQGNADSGRYIADLPFSFKCGQRSSREWVTIETANIASGDWQNDKTRTHVLSWKDVLDDPRHFRRLRLRTRGLEPSLRDANVFRIDCQQPALAVEVRFEEHALAIGCAVREDWIFSPPPLCPAGRPRTCPYPSRTSSCHLRRSRPGPAPPASLPCPSSSGSPFRHGRTISGLQSRSLDQTADHFRSG